MVGVLLTAVMASAATSSCKPDRAGYCSTQVVELPLSYGDRGARLRINVALGLVTSIQFPESVRLTAAPVLGNQAIFSFETQPGRLLVWPRLPVRSERTLRSKALLGHTTNLQVFLDFGLSVIVQMRVAPQRKAVHQVMLTFPERQRESAYVQSVLDQHARRFRKACEVERSEWQQVQTQRLQDEILRALLSADDCKEISERSIRDFLVVHVRRLCRVGHRVFVGFEIKNRARYNVFHLKRVGFAPEAGGAVSAEEPIVQLAGTSTLAFGERVEGGALIVVEGPMRWAYTLTVEEDGSHPRRVRVDGLSF